MKIWIDGKEFLVEGQERLIDVALKNGIDIPHICYEKEIGSSGSCGICLVKVKEKGIVKACEEKVFDGMEVITKDEEILEERKKAFLFLLRYSSHPSYCLFCEKYEECEGIENCLRGFSIKKGCKVCPKDGRCILQDISKELGLLGSNIIIQEKGYEEIKEPFFIRDYNYCILCSKCIRACYEIKLQNACISYIKQDDQLVHLLDEGCRFCGTCLDICPTGAIYSPKEEDPEKWIKSICPYCGCGCEIEVGIKENRIVKVKGGDGVNKGELCVKGRFGIDFVNSSERLTKPLLNKDGSFIPISWDLAIEKIRESFRKNMGKIGVLGSAKLTNEENFLIQKLSRLVFKTNNIDHCARLCHSPTAVALSMSIGYSAMTNSISDIEDAKTILVIGANPTENHPIIGLRIKRAKKKGANLIVINPMRIELCDIADIWIRLRPGTDICLLTAMSKLIIDMGLYDEDFIKKNNVEGFEEYKRYIDSLDLDELLEVCKVEKDKLIDAVRLYAEEKPSSIYYAMGITQHLNGTENVLAISNISILTGNLGTYGSGINPLRGQNNVQGACDMGVLPDLLPGYRSIKDPKARRIFEERWKEKIAEDKGLSLIEMVDSVLHDGIRAMYIIGENPVVTDPDQKKTIEALKKLDFLVVQDIFLTDTARLAHIVLPASSFLEKEGTFTNTERRVQKINKAIDPPKDALSDMDIICMIAKSMGYEKEFSYRRAEDVFQEIRELVPEYKGIIYERLNKGGIQWPCYSEDHLGTDILYKDGFPKRPTLFRCDPKPKDRMPEKEYPFILTTGRSLFHYHSGTMSMRIEGLKEIFSDPTIEINPKDAERLGISDGDMVEMCSEKGKIKVKAKISDRVEEGVFFSTFHFPESPVNLLSESSFDPMAKIPCFKTIPVQIKPILS